MEATTKVGDKDTLSEENAASSDDEEIGETLMGIYRKAKQFALPKSFNQERLTTAEVKTIGKLECLFTWENEFTTNLLRDTGLFDFLGSLQETTEDTFPDKDRFFTVLAVICKGYQNRAEYITTYWDLMQSIEKNDVGEEDLIQFKEFAKTEIEHVFECTPKLGLFSFVHKQLDPIYKLLEDINLHATLPVPSLLRHASKASKISSMSVKKQSSVGPVAAAHLEAQTSDKISTKTMAKRKVTFAEDPDEGKPSKKPAAVSPGPKKSKK